MAVRLLSGVRVCKVVVDEIRAAQKDGRRFDAKAMQASADWAIKALKGLVFDNRMKRQLPVRWWSKARDDQR